MPYQDIIAKIKPELDKSVDFFKLELQKIRVGRANPIMVENVEVDYYGTKLPLKQVATITAPEPRQILIQPWDKNSIETIAKVLLLAGLGMNPTVDGAGIRLNIPPLTEERRKEYQKILKEKTEDTKINIRRKREEAWSDIQKEFQEGKIREDDKFKGKDELQKVVDDFSGKIDDLSKRKEEEVMTV